jgi:hypothetical protein
MHGENKKITKCLNREGILKCFVKRTFYPEIEGFIFTIHQVLVAAEPILKNHTKVINDIAVLKQSSIHRLNVWHYKNLTICTDVSR